MADLCILRERRGEVRFKPILIYMGLLVGLTVVYFLAGRLGLTVSFFNGTIAPAWPPSGLAVASLALWGARLWPAIAVGAFAVNFFDAGNTPVVAAAISLGNTLEALFGAWLIGRFGRLGEPATTKDAVVLVAAFVLAPLPSASGGVVSLLMADITGWALVPQAWLVWWVGDAIGALVVAPAILSWLGTPASSGPARSRELAACLVSVGAVCGVVFAGDEMWARFGLGPVQATPILLPPLVWAALRLGARGETLALALTSALAIGATVTGHGPFAHYSQIISVVRLQFMLASVGVTLLILAAAITELKTAKRHAEEASRAKSRFVAAVRHDLSQPLQAAQLFVSALAQGRLDVQGRAIVGNLAGSLEAMDGALGALRDITAVECDVVRPEITEFQLRRLLDQLAEEYGPQMRRKGLKFRYVPCAVAIRTDRQLLGRVLRNLLSNAIRYTAEGRILLGCRRSSGGVRVEVWDTGPGIPPDDQEAIFKPFHRAANVGSHAGGSDGLGLGLATVYRLASLLGFTIALRSAVGKGSVFSVMIPTERHAAGVPR